MGERWGTGAGGVRPEQRRPERRRAHRGDPRVGCVRPREALLTALVTALPLLVAVGPATASGQESAREQARGPAAGPAAAPARVLLVGDSITQASVGDHSWRYFASKHLVRSGAAVDFVGPHRLPYVEAGTGWKAQYADPDFDQDHAATWGDRMASTPQHDRVSLMTRFRPDVVVVALGTNDLGPFHGLTAEQTAAGASDWVAQARAVVPGVDVVLVEVPAVVQPEVSRYNALLWQLAAQLDTASSRVVVAGASAGFVVGADDDRTADTYDGTHPNARGQVKVAAAVTDALAAVGLGRRYSRPLAFPAEGPREAPRLTVRTADDWALLSWSVPPGATSTDVWLRRRGKAWRRVNRAHPTATVGVTGLRPCVTYEVKVWARKGWTVAGEDVASRPVAAVAGPSVAGARTRPSARGARRSVKVRWARVPEACRYQVEVRHRAKGKVVVARKTVKSLSATVRVPAGVRAKVRVRPLGARDKGRWSARRAVRVPR